MVMRADIISAARAEIGYSRWADKDPGTKYGRWYAQATNSPSFGASGVPYCDMFVSYILSEVGISWLSAYVPGRESQARERGILIDKWDVRPGDLMTFDFDGAGIAQHIGIVDQPPNSNGVFYTIDGNTTWGTGGPQDNGGVVARRERYVDEARYGIRVVDDNAGILSGGNITEIQRILGAVQDNILGIDTEKRMCAIIKASKWGGKEFPWGIPYTQQVVGTVPDGIWGDASMAAHDRTVEALQRALGVDDDGIWGPDTWAAWERLARTAERP
jgi:hypothetical protein